MPVAGTLGSIWSCSPILAENEFRNASEYYGANNRSSANPLPAGGSERQKSKAVPEGSKSADDEKRPREAAVNAGAAGSIDQTSYTHDAEGGRPQNRFHGRRLAKAEREGKPRYTKEKKGARPPA